MSDLRTAAQQALEALEEYQSKGAPFLACDGAVDALRAALAQQADPTDPGRDVDVLREHVRHLERRVRQLHAQQVEPQGCATEEDCTKQPWCRIRGECQRKQAEPLNLADPAVQKRLAAQWGYVPAAQAEPVEPVDVGLLEYRGNSVAFIHQKMTAYRSGIDAAWDAFRAKGLHPDGKTSLANMIAKYTAPPQRLLLTEKEMYAVEEEARKNFRLSQKGPRGQQITYWDGLTPWLIRAVERAHGIKE